MASSYLWTKFGPTNFYTLLQPGIEKKQARTADKSTVEEIDQQLHCTLSMCVRVWVLYCKRQVSCWVAATCGLDLRQVKKDRLPPHCVLNGLSTTVPVPPELLEAWCLKLWVTSSFNIIRLSTYCAKVTMHNIQSALSWILKAVSPFWQTLYHGTCISQAFSYHLSTLIMLTVFVVTNLLYTSPIILEVIYI